MLVGVVKRGKYGERLLETITKHTDFQVVSVEVPQVLPGFIEDPEEFVRELNLDPRFFQAPDLGSEVRGEGIEDEQMRLEAPGITVELWDQLLHMRAQIARHRGYSFCGISGFGVNAFEIFDQLDGLLSFRRDVTVTRPEEAFD